MQRKNLLIRFSIIINCCMFHYYIIREEARSTIQCTIHCLAALGKIPQLQCKICLCLFHQECAKASANLDGTTFICEVTNSAFPDEDATLFVYLLLLWVIKLIFSFRIAISNFPILKVYQKSIINCIILRKSFIISIAIHNLL